MNAWHNQSLIELEHLVATDVERGLADEEVAARLACNEPNKLRKGKRFLALVISGESIQEPGYLGADWRSSCLNSAG